MNKYQDKILRNVKVITKITPVFFWTPFKLKNYQLPDLIRDHVDLDIHLDPQDGLERLRNHKIGIPPEKLGY